MSPHINLQIGGQGDYWVRPLSIDLSDVVGSSNSDKSSCIACRVMGSSKRSYHVKVQSHCDYMGLDGIPALQTQYLNIK